MLSVRAVNSQGNYSTAGCDGDLRDDCPAELAVKAGGQTVACRSMCNVFKWDEYCCKGVFENSMTCQPTYYSKKFKAVCPTAYSYAYDDPTSIFTYSGADYILTFCSTRKQTVCTYHDNRLVCSGSSSRGIGFVHKWLIVMVSSIISLWLWA